MWVAVNLQTERMLDTVNCRGEYVCHVCDKRRVSLQQQGEQDRLRLTLDRGEQIAASSSRTAYEVLLLDFRLASRNLTRELPSNCQRE